MTVFDMTQNRVIADHVKTAGTFFQRMKGLIGTRHLDDGEGLWIPKCQGVHTFGMSFSIDVIFLDQNEKVVQLSPELEPNHVGPVAMEAKSVLEFPAGTIEKTHIHVGDRLGLIDETTPTQPIQPDFHRTLPFVFCL